MKIWLWASVVLVAAAAGAAEREVGGAQTNAALQYWLAFQFMPNVQDEKICNATTDDKRFGFAVPLSHEQAKVLQGEGAQQALVHLHRGAALSSCDWGLDLRRDGLHAQSSLFTNQAWRLARLSCLRARWHFERGAWEKGLDDVIATMLMNRHASSQMLPSDHFGYMTENIALGTVAAYLPRMPRQARASALRRITSLPPFSPMREAMLRYENVLDWLVDNLPRAEREGRLLDFFAEFSPRDRAKRTVEQGGNAERLVKFAQDARPLMRQCADLMLLTPTQCDRVFHERYERPLKENPIAALVAPDYGIECRENAQASCRRSMFQAAVDVVERGRAALADHPDPFGSGPFEYIPFEGGFELRSSLVHCVRIFLVVGARKD
jgi:hypothetical protein